MRKEKFGDSLDFVKRGLLYGLAPPESWVVHPMLYDRQGGDPPGGGLNVRAYRLLLGLPPAVVRWGIQHTRADFQANVRIMSDKNLFIDPDTGMALHRPGNQHRNHVTLADVVIAARTRPGRLVLIFDQSFSADEREAQALQREQNKATGLRENGIASAAYVPGGTSRTTYLLWASTSRATVHDATERLKRCTGIPESRLERFYQQGLN